MGEQAKLVLKREREDRENGYVPKKRETSSLPKQAQRALELVREAKRREEAKRQLPFAGSLGNQNLIEQLKSLPPHTFKEVRRKK